MDIQEAWRLCHNFVAQHQSVHALEEAADVTVGEHAQRDAVSAECESARATLGTLRARSPRPRASVKRWSPSATR